MKSMNSCRIVLVTGGAASGKSALAESICCRVAGPGERMLYVAAMRPYGAEAEARIARHHALRAGKGFETVERYSDLAGLWLRERYGCILLEDLGNLTANQMFEAATPPDAVADAVVDGVWNLAAHADNLVLVANEVFSGAERYRDEMARYLDCLGEIGRRVAREAALVVESVCGLPQVLRGEWRQ